MGDISDCACDKTMDGRSLDKERNWVWGGCHENVRYGMLYAKHFAEALEKMHTKQLPVSGKHHHQHQHHHNHHHKHNELSLTTVQPPQKNPIKTSAKFIVVSDKVIKRKRRSFEALPICNVNNLLSANSSGSGLVLDQQQQQQLMKSLMATNSLKYHQDIRQAMNMHNNKAGRLVSIVFWPNDYL